MATYRRIPRRSISEVGGAVNRFKRARLYAAPIVRMQSSRRGTPHWYLYGARLPGVPLERVQVGNLYRRRHVVDSANAPLSDDEWHTGKEARGARSDSAASERDMKGTRVDTAPRTASRTGCVSALLAGIIILVPVLGDVACTVFIVTDDLSLAEKILWIAACWLTQWIGRTLYLLIGQKRNRLLNA